MPISLIPLPYAETALEPHISRETLQIHYGKHHKAYVDKVNEAIAGTPLADSDLEAIIEAAKADKDQKLFNNAAQAWNHGFYWHSLTPDRTRPSEDLAAAIERDFGSTKALAEKLIEEASDHFGSGWAWLVADAGHLTITSTHDAGTPVTDGQIPLLTVDVWEHAYYLDVQNKRPDYVRAVVDNRLNWRFASENFARSAAWKYPEKAMAQ